MAKRLFPLLVIAFLIGFTAWRTDTTSAQTPIRRVCPATVQNNLGGIYSPGGIVWTAFDAQATWVYDLDRGVRYPLPETAPCGRGCRPSPDRTWVTYFNIDTYAFNKMRFDGSGRALVNTYASDVEWWNPNTYLVWTPGHEAYLQSVETGITERSLNADGAISIQPGGTWSVVLQPTADRTGFERELVDLATRGLSGGIPELRVDLGMDAPYFNAQSWSPDGSRLAFVKTVDVEGRTGGEIFLIAPGEAQPIQLTNLSATYGAVRLNGLSVGELSWSPDGSRIAFWLTPITGGDPTANLGRSLIHMVDVNTGEITAYCGYTTTNHTPNPPRLVWSPDGTHLAFAGDVEGDEYSYLLLLLNTETGVFTAMSNGIVPAMGAADVFAWGRLP